MTSALARLWRVLLVNPATGQAAQLGGRLLGV